jgi:SpoVK/Ycf46/Vps4 family AAA+-type ATPase
MRFFTTEGPVNPAKNYFVKHRFNEKEVLQLIDSEKYFILHAPRQSGKTTCVKMFVDELNIQGDYNALYINVEPAQVARSDFEKGMKIILHSMQRWSIELFGEDNPLVAIINEELHKISGFSFQEVLHKWARASDKPVVLFIDEIDSLVGDTLISVLRQLRSGYMSRPDAFPQSVCMFGVRDVRDYRIWSDQEQQIVLGGSAFNIKAESLILKDFSFEQLKDLYEQHTVETGQQFTHEALEKAYYLTQGQPWLSNALAYQACFRDVINRSEPITQEVIERSKDTLIARRDTHIDVLVDRLQEVRVSKIIDAIINGEHENLDVSIDDIQYVCDLGLVARKDGILSIANPIYKEIIPRELAYVIQETIVQKTSWYQRDDGTIDMIYLMQAFQQFYRENIDMWAERNIYKESAPHIILMAFLQRIINGNGKIYREYALGRKRVDLLIEWPVNTCVVLKQQRIVLELKMWRGEKTLIKGLEQTKNYMDVVNATEGHLVLFDRSEKLWDEKIFYEKRVINNYVINVWGM